MTTRRITLELTEPQYRALAHAVAVAAADMEVENDSDSARRLNTMNRAWAKVREAWHSHA